MKSESRVASIYYFLTKFIRQVHIQEAVIDRGKEQAKETPLRWPTCHI